MNRNRFKIWIEALRSEKYKRGVYALCSGKSFCCLGVLCDLSKNDLNKKWKIGKFDGEGSALPKSVVEWLGIGDVVYAVIGNDTGYTFDVINAKGLKQDIRIINDYDSGDGDDYVEVINALERTFPD